MTGKQRFMAALNGEPVDRPPAASIVSVINYELMDVVGAHFPAANVEPEAMATLAAGAHEVMGFDSVMPIFSVSQEATALGCEVDWADETMMPTPTTHPWEDREVELKLPDGFPDSFLNDKYVVCALEAIRLLKKHFGDEVMILGKVMGPWTLSYHLYNVQEFLMDTLADPDRVRRSLDVLEQVPVVFAKAQVAAGADAIVWADHATGDLVRNTMYRDFLLARHQRLVPQVPAPVILHCCGPTLDRIQFFREGGFKAFHFESQVKPDQAKAEAAGKIRLAGNVNNPVTLFARGPAEVRGEAQRAIDAGIDIIAPECAVPLQTTLENLKEIVQTCEDNRKN
ncbi:MAG: MtaA/CmuA family methyltransferase [Anaerolineales bacterium]|nr:MtaA/CmuA family methyltransferase [Anaerolineales bacterium]